MKTYSCYILVLNILSINWLCNAKGSNPNGNPAVMEWCTKAKNFALVEECTEAIGNDPRSAKMKSPKDEIPIILLSLIDKSANLSIKVTEDALKAADDSKSGAPPDYIKMCMQCKITYYGIRDSTKVNIDLLQDVKYRSTVVDWAIKCQRELPYACKSDHFDPKLNGLVELKKLVKATTSLCEIYSEIMKTS